MRYRYLAINASGERVGGTLEAATSGELESRLARMGLDLVREQAGYGASFVAWLGGTSGRRRVVPRQELLNFWFQLKELLRVGVPLQEALRDLHAAYAEAGEQNMWRVIGALLEGIAAGQTLSQAMQTEQDNSGVFRPLFIRLMQAGEAAGDLARVMEDIIAALKYEDDLRRKTQKLLIYPAFVSVIIVAASLFLFLYLAPQLKMFLRQMGETLPFYTRALFAVADLSGRYGLQLLAGIVLGALALRTWLAHSAAARLYRDGLLLRLPIIGAVLQKVALSRFAGAFALLYAAGVPVLTALAATRDIVGNRAIRRALSRAEDAIREGRPLSAAFADSGFFPIFVVRMLHVGENTGALDVALENLRYFYQRDVDLVVERAERLIEPVLTLLLGALLGWIMLAFLGPVYDAISHVAF
ncbi:MAG: type II secretion system F family protein [Zoogloeaceae bacterium]|jgi:type IV pilus assembly protein PilC|nr:type II secretion system F family protein [Zoogloeaceae bacterium]